MKKNTANKKVLRAMSIALATMMAVSSMPMDVLASDAPADGTAPADDANKTYSEEGAESTTADAAREAVNQADASAQTVVNDVKNIQSDIQTDIPVINPETGAVLNEAHLIPEALKKVEDTLAVADADITIVENYLTPENISKVTGSGYDEAYKANVQAYVAAVAAYGEDGPKEPVAPADDADEATLQAYEASKKAYDDFKALKVEITKQLNKLDKDDYNAKNVLAPAIAGVTSDTFVSESKANEKVEAAYKEGTSIAEAASKEQGKADVAGEEALKLAEETEKQFDEFVENIKNAATIADANDSFDKLVETLKSAETTLAEKQAAYDAAKAAYEAYQKKYETQQGVINEAKADYESAKAIYEAAAEKYGDKNAAYDQKVEDLKKYHAALEDAEAKYISAKTDLVAIQSKAEALANAAEAAKDKMFKENAAALDVIAKIDVVNSDGKIDWGHENDLFASIVKNYYVPKVLKGTFVSLGSWQKPVNEQHRTDDDKANSVTAGEFNYIVLTYKDEDDNIITKYLDYKRERGVTANKGTDRIVIFEKRDNEVGAAEKQKNNKDTLLYNEGVNVDYYKVGNDKLTQSELDAKLRDGSIVAIDGVYYQQGKGAVTAQVTYDDTTGLVSDTTSTVDGIKERTVITIDTATVQGTFKKDAEGNVVQEFKADETTVVYHKSLSSDERGTAKKADGDNVTTYQYTSKVDAENALAAAKLQISDNDEEILGTVVKETHEEIDSKEVVVYQYQAYTETAGTSFAKTIDLTNEKTYQLGVWGAVTGLFGGNGSYSKDSINKEVIANGNNSDNLLQTGGFYKDSDDAEYYVSNAGSVRTEFRDQNDILLGNDSGFDIAGSVKAKAVQDVTLVKLETCDAKDLKKDLKGLLPNYKENNKGAGNNDNTSFAEALKSYVEAGKSLEGTGYLYIRVNSDGTVTFARNIVKQYSDVYEAKTVLGKNGVIDEAKTAEAIAKAKADAVNSLGANAIVEEIGIRQEAADYRKDVTTYGYELSYWKQIDSDTTNVVTRTDTYITVKGAVQQNKNFYDDSTENFVPSSNEDFKAFIANARTIKKNYEKLVSDAVQAKNDVLTAQAQVKALGDAINVLKDSRDKNGDKVKPVNGLKPLVLLDGVEFNPNKYSLKELKAFLATAEKDLKEAKDRLDNLKAQMADVEKVRDARIAALTPAPASPAEDTVLPEEDGAPAGLFATAGTTAYVSAGDVAPAAAPMFAFPTAGITTPAAGVAGARTGRTGNGTVDELEGTDGEILGNKKLDGDSVVAEDENPLAINEKTIKTIKDNETPLAAFPDEETNKMNWWWLLIIALLGATGEEMYRRNQKKKAEEAALKAEINQDNK